MENRERSLMHLGRYSSDRCDQSRRRPSFFEGLFGAPPENEAKVKLLFLWWMYVSPGQMQSAILGHR